MQQQLAFHQYVQAQAKLTAQQATQSFSGGKAGVTFGDQSQQGLMMALAARKAQQLQHVQGTLSLSNEFAFSSCAVCMSIFMLTTTCHGGRIACLLPANLLYRYSCSLPPSCQSALLVFSCM
jgi:membrane protease subunit (stomatin/prohibitin family)